MWSLLSASDHRQQQHVFTSRRGIATPPPPPRPAKTKHLYTICTTSVQRRRRWTDVVQMVYKRFVFTACLFACFSLSCASSRPSVSSAMGHSLRRFYMTCMGEPANAKHLYNICTTSAQRLRRWSNIVQMSYKCFVFAGRLCLRPSDCAQPCLSWPILNSLIMTGMFTECIRAVVEAGGSSIRQEPSGQSATRGPSPCGNLTKKYTYLRLSFLL